MAFATRALMILSVSTLAACDACKTAPDPNDATPPTFEFTIQNRTQGTTTTHPGGGNVHVANGDDLLVTTCAIDDGGLTSITTTSNSSWTCRSGDVAQQTGPGLVVPQTQNLGLDGDGKAWGRFCVWQEVKLSFACSSGLAFSSGSWGVGATAKNFANSTGNASLSIQVP